MFFAKSFATSPTQLVAQIEKLYSQHDFDNIIKIAEPVIFSEITDTDNKELPTLLIYYFKSVAMLDQHSKCLTKARQLRNTLIVSDYSKESLILDFYEASSSIVLQEHEHCRNLYQKIINNRAMLQPELDSLVVKSYANIAVSHHLEGNWTKADKYYKLALEMLEKDGKNMIYQETLATMTGNYLNLLFDNLERYSEAEELLAKTLAYPSNREVNISNYHLFLMAAEYYLAVGNQQKFIQTATALENFLTTNNIQNDGDLGYLFLRKAIFYANTSKVTTSQMMATQAEKYLKDEEGLFNYLPDVYDLMINNQIKRGENIAAEENIKKLVASNRLSERYPPFYIHAMAANHMATIGKKELSIAYADSAKMEFKKIKNPIDNQTTSYHSTMAKASFTMGDISKFKEHLISLKRHYLSTKNQHKLKELEVDLGLAFCEVIENNINLSLEMLYKLLNEINVLQKETRQLTKDALDDNTIIYNLYTIKALAWLKKSEITGLKSHLDSAWFYHTKTIGKFDQILGNLSLDSDRISASNTALYHLTIGYRIALEAYKRDQTIANFNKVIYFTQRLKGYSLNAMLNKQVAMHKAGVPQHLIDEEKHITNEIRFLNNTIKNSQKAGTDTLTNLLVQKQQLNMRKLEQISGTIKTHLHTSADFAPEILTLKKIQSRLTNDYVVIDYLILEDDCIIVTINKNSHSITHIKWTDSDLQSLKELQEQINTPFAGIDTSSYSKFIIPAMHCYNKLISPIEKDIENKKLIIIPYQELTYLPFEVLTKSKGKSNSFKTTDYLILHNPISYCTSLSLLPDYNNLKTITHGVTAFAPAYGKTSESQFTPLPEANSEIESISAKWNIATYKGDKATSSIFKKKISKDRILHLAMHSVADNAEPMESALIFSDDGNDRLKAYEIYTLITKSPLVVLNACNTGTGKHINGEGSMSLTRAFRFAGASSIVNTLWEVNDKASATIIAEFYKSLADESTKDAAMQKAKISYIKLADEITAHPFFWAAHVTNGDVSAITEKREIIDNTLIVIALAIMPAIIFYVIKRKKKKII